MHENDDDYQQQHHHHQQQQATALVTFKRSLDDARGAAAAKSAAAQLSRAQQKAAAARQVEAQRAKGVANPYAAAHERAHEATARARAAELGTLQAARRAALDASLKAEQRAAAARNARAEADKAAASRHLHETGACAQRARDDAYMRAHTRGGRAFVDPTGRCPRHPSEVAEGIVPKSFGLGRADAAAIATVAARLGDAAGGGAAAKTSDADGDGNKLHLRPLSKLEADQLAAAQAHHRARVTGKLPLESAGGSSSSSNADPAAPAFVASPSEVVFADAAAGVTRRASVALTNRSAAKAAVRLQGVPHEFAGVLEAALPPSGMVAPGTACVLHLALTPRAEADGACRLPLLTPTGTLWLPVQWLARRALPALALPREDGGGGCHLLEVGGSGGVMVAASAARAVSITNSGALGVGYEIAVEGPLAATAEVVSGDGGGDAACADGSLEGPRLDRAVRPGPSPGLGAAGGAGANNGGGAIRVAGFVIAPARGFVPGRGDAELRVAFAPRVPGPVRVPLTVRYRASVGNGGDGDGSAAGLPPPPSSARVVLAACGRAAPVTADRDIIDFRSVAGGTSGLVFACVVPGRTYAAMLVLRNSAAATMKVQIQIGREPAASPSLSHPPPMPDALAALAAFSASPALGYVQGGGALPVSIAFTPRPDTAARLACFLQQDGADLAPSSGSSVLRVPVAVLVPGQPLPVRVTLRAELGGAAPLIVTAEPPAPACAAGGGGDVAAATGPEANSDGTRHNEPLSLDFGRVALGEAAAARIAVANSGPLPQGFSFAPLPRGVEVRPSAHGVVQPGAHAALAVRFSPLIAGPQAFRLRCATLAGAGGGGGGGSGAAGDVLTITGKCFGVEPALALSASVVRLPATAAGDACSASVMLSNRTGAAQTFHIAVPGGSHLRVAPAAGRVGPGGSVRLLLEFRPPHEQSRSTQDRDGGGDGGAGAAGVCTAEWVLPVRVRPCSSSGSGDGSGSNTDGSKGEDGDAGGHAALHLAVATATAPREVEVEVPPEHSGGGGGGSGGSGAALPQPPRPRGAVAAAPAAVVDFGALPVGGRRVVAVVIRRSSDGDDPSVLPPAIDGPPLDPSGPFSIAAALRPAKGGATRVLLAFSPTGAGEAREVLALRVASGGSSSSGGGCCARIALVGRGVAPMLELRSQAGALLQHSSGDGDSSGSRSNADACRGGESIPPGCVDLGTVPASEAREARLTLTNASPFAVAWAARCREQAAALHRCQPARDSSQFFVRPAGSTLAPGASAELVVVLCPGGLGSPALRAALAAPDSSASTTSGTSDKKARAATNVSPGKSANNASGGGGAASNDAHPAAAATAAAAAAVLEVAVVGGGGSGGGGPEPAAPPLLRVALCGRVVQQQQLGGGGTDDGGPAAAVTKKGR